jgi:hypothetical protein
VIRPRRGDGEYIIRLLSFFCELASDVRNK